MSKILLIFTLFAFTFSAPSFAGDGDSSCAYKKAQSEKQSSNAETSTRNLASSDAKACPKCGKENCSSCGEASCSCSCEECKEGGECSCSEKDKT